MNDITKLAILLRLREAQESLGKMFENVALDSTPLVCLNELSVIADLTCELQSAYTRMARQPGELTFGSGNVAIPAERTAAEDKASQHYVESGRAAAGIASLLDDSASVTNHDRDHRVSA